MSEEIQNDNLLATDEAGASCGCGSSSAAEEHGYTPDKKRYLARLKRIEGQVRGLHRMVDEDTYCIDVLTQVTAVQSALKSVALALLDDHMQHCVLHAAQQGEEEAVEKLDEVSAAVARLVR
ncbi:MAG TPA: metal-sensitive transcriptional regulator [Candidatus Corynebacterium avicola]|uniref:Metal-sensitive transcriptional regulator n=1 Tax=Candidatus Corynebacterium avicola TaxID=2838527 RepID=A0A9D1RP52_9CORY|nr:metal-sensitive transcriptional regulator [Candidatus Corynebacterium avicola]